LVFLELPPERKKEIRKYFKYWLIRVVSNNWRSSTSPFWTKYRSTLPIDPNTIYTLSEVQPEMEQEQCPTSILDILIEDLYISDQNVFKDYYTEGLTIKEITEKYKVEKNYVWGVIDRIRKSLRRRVMWMEVPEIDFVIILAPLVGKKRLNINERQLVVDVNNHINNYNINYVHDRDGVNCALKNLVSFFRI